MPTNIFLAVPFSILVFLVLLLVATWLASRPLYAAWSIIGLGLLDALLLEPVAFQVGILIYPADIFFLVLSLSCFIRLTLIASPKTVPWAWWVIGVVQLSLFIWGLTLFGKFAGVDYRTHFYVWVAVIYFCSVKWTEPLISRIANAWVVYAVALCLLVAYRWTASSYDPLFAQKMMAFDTTGVAFRVIGAGQAIVIAIATLILLFKAGANKITPIHWLLVPFFVLTIVVLQHRSVWMSLFIGTMCLLWALQRRKRGGKSLVGALLLIVPLVFFFAIPGGKNDVLESVKTSADQALSTTEGTMVGRVDRWQELLLNWASSKDLVTYLVGKPYGGGYINTHERTDDGKVKLDFVPHNHLIHVLYRGGLIGLAATLLIFYQLWRSGVRQLQAADKRWAPYFLAVFAALFAYYIPYWATYGHGMLIGLAISYFGLAGNQRRSPSVGNFEPRSASIGTV